VLLNMEQEPLSGDVTPLRGPVRRIVSAPRWIMADHLYAEIE
jgi:hypothetical protein